MEQDLLLNGLLEMVEPYIHKEENKQMIIKAYNYAKESHNGQFRKSGEPYINHPIEVAKILASLHAGPATIAASLLHDVEEDCEVDNDKIKELFGSDIAEMVEGVTKVTRMKFSTLEKQQIETQQKMLLAMAKDIRVILIKLADRLHNIRTIDALREEKRERIATETLEIYAPLAHRLGMFKIKAELEDRSLKYKDSAKYQEITELLATQRQQRFDTIDNMIEEIKGHLYENNLKEFTIKGRIKNIYSIYKKMMSQDKRFEDIYDILAIRIIVDNVEECYQVLGIIHAHYIPIPKRFKDYIAVPKPNMYQSLHTTVIGLDGQPFEIQIRTEAMDKTAEYGIAAHWAYKEGAIYSKEKEQFEIAEKLKWYSDLLKLSEEETDESPKEFVETIKSDILDANVYVYTPKGEVVDLPNGSTPLDFAYKIHSDVGNRTIGAIVNNKIVPLSYVLETGDIVSMRLGKLPNPSESWLNIVKTNHAKHKIKTFLNKKNRDDLINSGKEAVEREFNQEKIYDYELNDEFVVKHFSKNNTNTLEDMYFEVGKGNISTKTIVSRYTGSNLQDVDAILAKHIERTQRILTTNSDTGVVVEGLKNPKIKLASCCSPIPGDKIVGYVSKSNGIVVHSTKCKNIDSYVNYRKIQLEWATNIDRKYPVTLKITSLESPSMIGDIATIISSMGLSIAEMRAKSKANLELDIKIKILVPDLTTLDLLIVNLHKLSKIKDIGRENICE